MEHYLSVVRRESLIVPLQGSLLTIGSSLCTPANKHEKSSSLTALLQHSIGLSVQQLEVSNPNDVIIQPESLTTLKASAETMLSVTADVVSLNNRKSDSVEKLSGPEDRQFDNMKRKHNKALTSRRHAFDSVKSSVWKTYCLTARDVIIPDE
ncbi:hypothetical protein DPMN_036973 [Dreissena polymorpha]|uniref:Uncharacterized protein n=1 Tax=Dreissena polymorpha TaxID=45954 RepID=A0A9D4RLX8_DREPO|nr:hypothetical protein DPMN_036973 [Dreissena polymorpha]